MRIDNNWFYSDPPKFLRIFLVYIKGDALVLLPFVIALFVLGFFSQQIMLLSFCVYLTLRSVGEMVYWLLQQFFGGKYRPFDFGLKNLDNNAIYILYQVASLSFAVLGAVGALVILFL